MTDASPPAPPAPVRTRPPRKKRSPYLVLLLVMASMGLVGVILVAVAAALGGVKSNSVLHLRLSGEVPDVATHNPLAALLGNTTVDL